MYLRKTSRRNKDGSEAAYLALAHNERDPDTGVPKARIIHNFGRAELVDRDALARLVASISRFLDPAEAVAATAGADVELRDSRPMGVAWVADQLWERLGIGAQIRAVARAQTGPGRPVDVDRLERAIFAMVANRLSATPLSKLAGCTWVAERAYIPGLAEVDEDTCYRAMDFLLGALDEIQEAVFFSVANLLNLQLDVLLFDTTSTYWQTERADDDEHDGAFDTDPDTGPDDAGPDDTGPDPGPDDAGPDDTVPDDAVDGVVDDRVVEAAVRTWGHSKDHRRDLPQVVIGMAVTREGIPVRLWTFPGDTADQVIIRTVKDDLRAWGLHRVIWVLDRGFSSDRNRRYLQRAGGNYIMGEKLRGSSHEAAAALGRQGRYHTAAPNLRVKQVRVDDGAGRDRFIICHNPDEARRDVTVRDRILARLEHAIAGSDTLSARERAELAGRLKTKPTYRRFLRTTPGHKLRIDRTAVRRDAHYDGKYLLRTADESLTPADVAECYKGLYDAERGWRDLKTVQIQLRPVYHHKDQRIQAHVQLCWLALLLLRVAELAVGDTWRNIANELDRMHLVTLATAEGEVAQRTEPTAGQRSILAALELDEPPRFFEFSPTTTG